MNALVRQLLVAAAGAALMVVAGAPAGAQNPAPSTDPSATQPQHTIQMVPVSASLDHSLDAKKAKQGDPVTAKLQKDANVSQQDLPRNTVLEGHVDQVQPSQHKSDSTMVVTFDKAKLKSGKELPIKATVLAIAEPDYLPQQSMAQPAGSAMPATGGGGMPGGSAPSGGANPGGAPPAAPRPQAAPMDPQPSGTQQQALRNGVPGVMLQSDIHQHASATFTAKGRNVHLPDGTRMDVALVVIPAGMRIQ